MSADQNPSYSSKSPSSRWTHLRRDNHARLPSGYGPEPVVFNNPVHFDDTVYSTLKRRDSIWSNGSAGPLVLSDGTVFSSTEKFPCIEVSDFSYMAPTSTSSLIYSPPSSTASRTVSRTPSIGSACSPVQTDFTSEFGHGAHLSRGPSPLRNAARPPSNGLDISTCSMSSCNTSLEKNGTVAHQSSGYPHICLWGGDRVCDPASFASREELNRHVKMDHLLECPVLGCTETVFENRELLDCHMRWDHSKSETSDTTVDRSSKLLEASLDSSNNGVPSTRVSEKASVRTRDSAEDRILKTEMSIGISKKRCREQLRIVLERRLRRANGDTLRNTDSPGTIRSRTPRLFESASFPMIWEHSVLPFLIEFMPKWCGPGHVISVTRGKKPGTRRVCIMTKRGISTARKMVIAGHVRDLLPETYRSTVTFVFSIGEVDRLVWSRGLGKEMPDEVCEPRNPFAYISPCMGDSIGASLDDGEEVTATLGPCVTAEGGCYWLACFHPFIGASQRTSPVLVEHPSPQDRAQCLQQRHDALGSDLDYRIGNLTATSGYNLKTTRITHDPYWEDHDKEPPLVVTDWILISASTQQANMLRKYPTPAQRRETPITSTSSVSPGANVVSTGRTSGVQRGQVCDIPAYVDGSDNGTGKGTREWFIEEPFPYEDENEWIRGGIGVEGDSGAAIVDSDTNALIGQLWGRNKYFGPGPRLTFFTPISDIFDDIQERCGMLARPQLPQYRDEADRWSVYPICRQCFDLRAYLETRRSSRESLMSMIGAHEMRGEHDNDLTSVSELATPKDQSNLVRHIGPEETASSFGGGSVVSPAPIHAFYPISQAASPGASELRSPYAQTLSDQDLYEPGCPQSNEVGFGKRAAILPPPRQSNTQQSTKRRRIV